MAGIFNPAIFNPDAFNVGDAGGGPIFNIGVFNTLIFNTGDEVGAAPDVVVVKTGTGGIDPGEGLRRKRVPYKPTGVLHLPKKALSRVDERVEDSRSIQAEIAAKLAREFTEESAGLAVVRQVPIELMSPEEVNREIGILLRRKLQREEDELLLLLLMASAV
jgi:hypothetical protein